MRLHRALGPAIRALVAHRVRAILALSSIAIGVAAVVLTNALGVGAQRELLLRMESMGTNLLVVRPAQVRQLAARKTMRGVVTTLEVDDYEAIAQLPFAAAAAPGAEGPMRVKASNSAMVTKVLGTTAAFAQVRQFQLASGRFLDADDAAAAQRVCVLGARVAETLFRGEDPVGQDIRLRGVPFEIIGVLEAKGVLADGSDEDNQVLIPIRTAQRRVFNSTWLSTVFVSVQDVRKMDEAESAITRLLRKRHRLERDDKPDDFAVQNTSKTLSAEEAIANSLTMLGTGLAAGALLVGGAGILALMLLAVRERTTEIGLRMAVGAKPRDILAQFLLEATLLSVGGWLAGIGLSALGAMAVAFGTSWKVGVPANAVLASLAMAVIIGIGFGTLPARKASLLPPIQALGST